MGKVTTAYLMTCAAIGVAGGVMLAFAWWLSTALFATVPFASVAIAGLWMMPAVIALRLIRRPFAGLLVGLVSGLVLTPFYTAGAIATTLFWALFPELPFLVTIYRRWSRWLHYAGAVVAGVAYPILAAQSFDLWTMTLPVLVVFFVLCTVSCLVATWGGIAVADRLTAAGVARLARRKPAAA